MSTGQDGGDPVGGDSVVRGLTEDGAFRVIACRTTETVRGAIAAQGAHGETARCFGELITGAILVREAMAPGLRVQAILKGTGGTKGSFVADAHPDGTSRGLVNFGSGGQKPSSHLDLGKGSLLQVMRTLPSGSLHQGVVEVPEGKGVSGALMAYMAESEQVASTIAVAAVFDGDTVVAAGGYLVQLLPEVERGPLMVMTERLTEFPELGGLLRTSGGTPDALLSELLYAMPYALLSESPLSFACHCSQVRVVASLASLPRADVEDLIRGGEALDIRCDYCGTDYAVSPIQLQSLLTPS